MTDFPDSFRIKMAAGMLIIAALLYFAIVQMEKWADRDKVDKQSVQTKAHQTSLPDFREYPSAFGGTGSSGSVIDRRPNVPVEQEGKPFGENSDIFFYKDLETSLEKQGDPKVWLEFMDQNGANFHVEISAAHGTAVRTTWENSLNLAKANAAANNDEARIGVRKSYINKNAIFLRYLEDVEVKTPHGIRRLSESESITLTRVLNVLAIRRYEELAAMDREVRSRKAIDSE